MNAPDTTSPAVLIACSKSRVVAATHKLHGLYESTYEGIWIGIVWQRHFTPVSGWTGVLRRPAETKLRELEELLIDMLSGTVVNGRREYVQTYAARRRLNGKAAWIFDHGIAFGRAIVRPIGNSMAAVEGGYVPTSLALRGVIVTSILPTIRILAFSYLGASLSRSRWCTTTPGGP
jgi:hypothetical protein